MAVGTEPEAVFTLRDTRRETLALVAELDADALEAVHDPLMSPLVWDLGHIAAYEDLWIAHRLGGLPLLRPELAALYDAFETPRAVRGEIPFLRTDAAHEYLQAVRDRTEAVLAADPGGPEIVEMVLRHEQQHTETMLQAMQLARLAPRAADPRAAGAAINGTGWVEVPDEGPCTLGAGPEGFAYDNERPCFSARVPGFRIARTPVTNATWRGFCEGGGYVRREWWSDEGWAWKEQYDISRPLGWSADLRHEWRLGHEVELDPHRPVVHISWFEADAFARAHGARLPTEREWEKAATWDHEQRTRRPPNLARANLDQRRCGPDAVSPENASPCGALGMMGDVWEWTATEFAGYAGFAAHPYREYSEVFFGQGYRVLRGGSWATRARSVSPTFRNWDLPIRRQIFSGLRLAKDL